MLILVFLLHRYWDAFMFQAQSFMLSRLTFLYNVCSLGAAPGLGAARRAGACTKEAQQTSVR